MVRRCSRLDPKSGETARSIPPVPVIITKEHVNTVDASDRRDHGVRRRGRPAGDIGCPGVSRRGQSLQGADLQSAEVELTLRSIPSKNCHHIA